MESVRRKNFLFLIATKHIISIPKCILVLRATSLLLSYCMGHKRRYGALVHILDWLVVLRKVVGIVLNFKTRHLYFLLKYLKKIMVCALIKIRVGRVSENTRLFSGKC